MRATATVLLLLGLSSCGGGGPSKTVPPTGPGASAGAGAADAARPPLTQLLTGPFADLDAHAASLPARRLGQPSGLDAAPPLAELALLVSEIDGEQGHCALAVRTDAGWFIGPWGPSCHEPSYVEIEHALVSAPDDGVVAIELDVIWHTKNYDDQAAYRLSAVCGAPIGAPRCSPLLVTACQPRAPVGDCGDRAWDLTLDVDGAVATFTAGGDPATAPPPEVAAALVGPHPLW